MVRQETELSYRSTSPSPVVCSCTLLSVMSTAPYRIDARVVSYGQRGVGPLEHQLHVLIDRTIPSQAGEVLIRIMTVKAAFAQLVAKAHSAIKLIHSQGMEGIVA